MPQYHSTIFLRPGDSRGFTLVEMIIVLFVSGLVLLTLTFFLARLFRLPPEYVEQGGIVADARIEMDRLSETIRNARDVGSQAWLVDAEPCYIRVLSNIDADNEVEQVEYWVNPIAQIQPSPSGSPISTPEYFLLRSIGGGPQEILARSLRNDCTLAAEKAFSFYSLGGGQALEVDPTSTDLEAVDRVTIKLIVDINPDQAPAAAEIVTVVTPGRGAE
jgi:prepilin-type N-terminal cleavage/methylation domain-containing protein